jgi:hypothetical protein
MNGIVRPSLALAAVLACSLSVQAQTSRWNAAAPGEVEQDPPAVSVWLDRSIFSLGEPVRVAFRVEEDAFVVVARVDWDGNLTVLYPRSRNMRTATPGGRDHYIASARMGSRATFVANERPGASGYVFALASYGPIDLSRLSQRDFSAWVTGISRSRPTTRYVGDPYRVIQRFARLVLWDQTAEWDYDVDFYSVDQPTWVTTTSAYGYCGGYGSFGRLSGINGMREFEDDIFGYNSGYGLSCRGMYNYLSCYAPLYGYGFAIPYFCGRLRSPGQVANGPNPPPVRGDDGDSSRVNAWVPDSIGRPNVNVGKGGGGAQNGPHVMTVDGNRPNPVTWDSRDDLSFSIPGRALRGIRERRESPSTSSASSGPTPRPVRSTPETASQPIEWVRPPRSFDPPTRDTDRLPSRGAIRRNEGAARAPDRGVRDWSPPPRTASPNFEREPVRSPSSGSARRYEPPRDMGPRPIEHRPSSVESGGARPASPPPSPPPAAASGGGASGGGASGGGAKPPEPERKPPPTQ